MVLPYIHHVATHGLKPYLYVVDVRTETQEQGATTIGEPMPDFFELGKYAGFIWASYGIVAIVLAALAVASWRFMKAAERRLDTVETAGRKVTNDGTKA